MRYYISLTDYNWYRFLCDKNYDEINFWRPGTKAFAALVPGELFVFKLKSPHNAIVGGGFFTSYSLAPIDLVWSAFGTRNGTATEKEFVERLADYRLKNSIDLNYPTVGCILLSSPFFLQEDDWIRSPKDWSSNIVTGKRYSGQDGSEGQRVYQELVAKLQIPETQLQHRANRCNMA